MERFERTPHQDGPKPSRTCRSETDRAGCGWSGSGAVTADGWGVFATVPAGGSDRCPFELLGERIAAIANVAAARHLFRAAQSGVEGER
jgi:hypothetical protein